MTNAAGILLALTQPLLSYVKCRLWRPWSADLMFVPSQAASMFLCRVEIVGLTRLIAEWAQKIVSVSPTSLY